MSEQSKTPRTDHAAKAYSDYWLFNAAIDYSALTPEKADEITKNAPPNGFKFAELLETELTQAREELKEWQTLMLWGGTPEKVHDFIKGQQERIYACQLCEEENAELRAKLKL